MRKCRNCRSLLLGDVESCPRCGAPVPVAVAAGPMASAAAPTAPTAPASASWAAAPGPSAPTAPTAATPSAPSAPAAGGASIVPSYSRLSIPSPVAPAPVGSGGGATPGAPPPLREVWQPVVIETPTAAPSRQKPWGRVALVVAIAVVVGAAVMHLHSDPLPAGTKAFVAGNGVDYMSPDGTFQVQLPAQPQVDRKTLSVNGVSATLYIAISQSDAYEMGVASVVFPSAFAKARVNDALDQMTSEGVKSANGTSVSKTLTTHGSQPAMEVKFKAGDGYSGRMLVIASGSSLIMVIVHAKTGTDRLYKTLEESLLIH